MSFTSGAMVLINRNFSFAFLAVIVTFYLADAIDFVFFTDIIFVHFNPPSPSTTNALIDILSLIVASGE
jgi:hypothetical protein